MTHATQTATDDQREAAKTQLLQVLPEQNGDVNHPAVAAAIATLSALNPTPAPAHNDALLDGDWDLISAPNFPDGEIQADGTYRYSLGRLAFNMFQPATLKVAINRVSQPVWPIAEGPQRTHDIVVEFTIADADYPPLTGIVRNLGVCEPISDTTLQVQFTGGVLEPVPDTDRAAWQDIFGDQTPRRSTGLKAWWQQQFLKLMFGLRAPTGPAPDTGRVTFDMARSPKGRLEILYLDHNLRITRGQRETVLVCARSGTSAVV